MTARHFYTWAICHSDGTVIEIYRTELGAKRDLPRFQEGTRTKFKIRRLRCLFDELEHVHAQR